jgi:hypothetical protein
MTKEGEIALCAMADAKWKTNEELLCRSRKNIHNTT